MAYSALAGNSVEPLGGPNLGLSVEQGDSWGTAVTKINAMLTEIYNRTGGTGTLTNNLPSPWNNFRNTVVGGDFTINPWQRGTAFTGIAATVTYTADRFFVVGTNASVSAKAARVAFSGTAGFNQAFRFGRAANASSLSAIVAGQIMESANSIRLQGQVVTLSFWAASESNFSAANIGVQVTQGGGTDQSAVSALAGTWTGQSDVISSTQAITSTMTRYSFSGTVGTSCSQVGLLLSMTPVGSAGVSDSVLIQGIQLEVGSGPSNFEHRDIEIEISLCQRYCFVLNEPLSGIAVAPAIAVGTDKYGVIIPTPTTMRIAPTVVVTNGSFALQRSAAYLAVTGLAATGAAAATHTQFGIALTMLAAGTVNNAATFIGGSGIGVITASAEY